jgi:hypothetical protein
MYKKTDQPKPRQSARCSATIEFTAAVTCVQKPPQARATATVTNERSQAEC